jgi:PAS domain S-box-containing protein
MNTMTSDLRGLHNAMESAIEGVAKVDAHGRYTYVNETYAAMTGYLAQELIGTEWHATVHESDRERMEGERRNLVNTGKAALEACGLRKDGTVFDNQVTLIADRNDDGTLVGHFCFVKDISERKKAERLKDELISTVSHELRTPLTSIRGALGLVAAMGRGQLPEKIDELLQVAHRNSDRLALLVNDILDIERLEMGALQPKLEICSLSALLEQAVVENAAYAAAFDVTYDLNVEPGLAHVAVDPARFQQIMANLLSNAAKFTGQGTTVEVAAKRNEGSVAVFVRDRGPGIPEQLKARLYEKFAQFDPAPSSSRGGTGLGLAITRRLVRLMGGEISYRSLAGEGTAFVIAFPAVDESLSAAEGAAA